MSRMKLSRIKLYDKPECPFCWKVRLALHELAIEAQLLDSQSPDHRPVWQALAPRKTVPVLVNDDTVIYESNVILEYLADISGSLLPKNPAERIQPRLINAYSDGVIGAALREVIFEKRGKPEAEWDRARIAAGITAFEQALEFLSEQLGEREFFGNCYSLPECALTARFGLAEAYGVHIPSQFANLRAWFERMKARPSYRATAPQSLIS
ncbi:glutathione S-transferase family protein [Marinobacterium arenosum]|uniref:glutathione S-transferase family protein n=1 Tax=Marinobacterium arenosum TaxID=2862496 RepID=UPI001C971235|nr:glutathione S-transferase family protein [Marinobacterium arenosum]MBY4676682.1 glutathione S-transferase family protein [Marinobacterium arenosum]